MGRKKFRKPRGRPFTKDDPRICKGGPPVLGGDDLRLICRSTSNDVGPLPEDEKDAGKRLLETSRLRPAKGRNGGVHIHPK